MLFHQCGRDESCECRGYRFHSEFSHPVEYLVLELDLRFVPVVVERAVEAVQVAHSVPRQVSCSREEPVDFVRLQTELQPYPFCNGFCCHACQRHVHSVKGHPVDFLRPSVPVPVWCCVSECADIQEITQLIRGCGFFFPVRPFLRDVQFAPAPANHRAAGFTKVFVHRVADRARTAALEREVAACRFDFIPVQPFRRLGTHLK